MATTKDNIDESNSDFSAAFAEETQAAPEQSEDEAFGLTDAAADAAATEGDGETEGSTMMVTGDGAEDGGATDAQPVDIASAGAMPEQDAAAGPEMSQSEKSWEGRLRAREAELKAMAADLEAREKALAGGEGASATEPDGDEPGAFVEGGAIDAAEGGEMSADEAIRQLSEDFGPEFVKMIMAIAESKAAEISGGRADALGQTVDEMINDIRDLETQRHYKAIKRAHPDFVDVYESEGFNSWLAGQPPERKEELERIAAAGDADEINALLTEYKGAAKSGPASSGGMDEFIDDELEGATGVRSSGLRLPDEPKAGKNDFVEAWEQA